MKYLLWNLNFLSDETLKNHYIWQHLVHKCNCYFKDLFTPEINLRGCNIFKIDFKNSITRKNHMLLLHYNQMGGNRRNQKLPINVLRRGPITYFSINYNQHKSFYNFFQEQVVDDFLDAVYSRFLSDDEYKIQGYAKIINQQQREFIIAESTRVWLTNTYTARHFNNYVKSSIKNKTGKRIIANSLTGNSWFFKRFQRLTIMATSARDFSRIMSG